MLYPVLEALRPLLVPICFVVAWGMVGLLIWSLWAFARDSFARAKRMHQVPCSRCRYFTESYHLKCAVHPDIALSEEAIGCPDYAIATPAWVPAFLSQYSPESQPKD